jgi:hypothetical protein
LILTKWTLQFAKPEYPVSTILNRSFQLLLDSCANKLLKWLINVEFLVDVMLIVEKSLVLCLQKIQVMLVALAYSKNALQYLEENGAAL